MANDAPDPVNVYNTTHQMLDRLPEDMRNDELVIALCRHMAAEVEQIRETFREMED